MTLNGGSDYLLVFLIAAVLGCVGGVTYELLLTVRGRTGAIEKPGKLGPRHVDLGVFASMIVGAVAAVAALWVFPPETVVNVNTDGATTTTRTYDLIKLVGLSLIVGSAGGSFLSAMQARALALVKTEQAQAKTEQAEKTVQLASAQLDAIEAVGSEGAAGELSAAITTAKAALQAASDSSSSGNPRLSDF